MKTAFVKKSLFSGAAILWATLGNFATANNPINLDDLLNRLEQGSYQQNAQNKRREQDFINRRAEQDRLLQEAIAEQNAQLARSEQLETTFEENEMKIAGLNETLTKRMGSLKELFGVLQQVSGDMSGKLSTSITSAQFPGREKYLDELAVKMGSSSKLASIEEIEQVWFTLQKEMTESGKVASFQAEVVANDGSRNLQEVIRVGTFNLVSDGKYLEYNNNTGSILELPRQPSDRFLATARDLQEADGGVVGFTLDPTRGSILGALIQSPNLGERIEQGGEVGYIILALGILALIIALERFITLFIVDRKLQKQLQEPTPMDNNPLGRILKVKDEHPNVAADTLELKLSEAILKELPPITRNVTFIKIISVVAPLMGLLGTVTGMIITFQQMNLFGTGDPKLMAGGISQALVTTVLGLVVAIPTVLLFTWINNRSKRILHVLQEQSAGIIAERAEQGA